MLLGAPTMLHQRYYRNAMVQKLMYGAQGWFCTFCFVVSPHFGQVNICHFLELVFVIQTRLTLQILEYVFSSETEAGIFRQILRGKLDFESEPWPSISDSAKDLVRNMLTRDPKKRFSAHEVLCKYTHPLISLM